MGRTPAIACGIIVLSIALIVGSSNMQSFSLRINGCAIASIAIIALALRFLQPKAVARLWCALLLMFPLVWNTWVAVMPEMQLLRIVQREPEVRDSTRVAYCFAGVLHATMPAHTWKRAAYALSFAIFLGYGGGVLFSRLGDLSLVRLLLLNNILPMLFGSTMVELIRSDSTEAFASRFDLLQTNFQSLDMPANSDSTSGNSDKVPSSIELTPQATQQQTFASNFRIGAIPDLRDEEIQLQETIGKGGVAIVRRARWQGTVVAVKVLKAQVESKDVFKEVNLLAHLRHPCICTFFGAYHLNVGTCLVLEYLEGGTLAQFLYPEYAGTCATPYAAMMGASAEKGSLRLLQWSLHVADGLRYLHSRDVVHKDIKCSNVLLDATQLCAKVSDFGLSQNSELDEKLSEELCSTTSNWSAGSNDNFSCMPSSKLSSACSLRYLAPEIGLDHQQSSFAAQTARDICTSAGT